MSYSISINGHGATEESVRSILQAALNQLGESGSVYASYSGSDKTGKSFEGASGMTAEAKPEADEADPA